jgi:hypothetical protein
MYMEKESTMEPRYTIDVDQIVSEALEREVMVVNLENGYYYVLEGTGAELWPWLTAGASVPEAAAALAQRYSGDAAQIEAAVRQFVADLAGEALLRPAEAGAAPTLEVAAAEQRPPFTLPALYKYTDMANLVQMDPIRDFDEGGWPRRAATGKKTAR